MNNEMKRILSSFFMTAVIIYCLSFVCVGAVTARQRSEYNTYCREYAVLALKSQGEKLSVSLDEKKLDFDLSRLKLPQEYRGYVYVTPLAGLALFYESVKEILTGG